MLKGIGAWIGGLLVIGCVRVRLLLPEGASRRLAEALGWTASLLLPGRRRVVDRNLRRAFPDRSDADRARLAAGFYAGTAGWFFEMLLLFREGRDRNLQRYRIEGAEHLRAALALGRGVIGVSAHVGPFAGLGTAVASLGVPFSFLYRRPKEVRIARLFDDWLDRSGARIIADAPRQTAGLRCLHALARGELICLLADQHFPAGIEVPFFGHPSKTGIGAALLAVRSGAPLLPLRATRQPDGGVLVRIDPPMDPPADRTRESLAATTAALASRIESWIREDPAGWFWIHRRWKDLDRMEAERGG